MSEGQETLTLYHPRRAARARWILFTKRGRRGTMSYILEPVDSVEVLTLMDNSTDMTLESDEVAARTMFGAGPVPATAAEKV